VSTPPPDVITVEATVSEAIQSAFPTVNAVLHRFNILNRVDAGDARCPQPGLVDAKACAIDSLLLSDAVLARLASAMPRRFAATEWRQLYSAQTHGFSLATLYTRAAGSGASLVVVRTSRGHVLGALLSDGIRKPQPGQFFYGTGESFLFSVSDRSENGAAEPCADESRGGEGSAAEDGPGAHATDVRVYHWSGENYLFCFSSPSSVSIGGGNGAAGLYLEGSLVHGSTGPTETFANPVLCPPQGLWGEPTGPGLETERFEIADLEVWGVDPVALKHAASAAANPPAPPSIRRVTSSLTNMSHLMLDGFTCNMGSGP